MWISRKEYKRLTEEKQSLETLLRHRGDAYKALAEYNAILLEKNMKLSKEIDSLKAKYADEVEKNFKLASWLSENKSN